jgi:hypothetical protein
MGFWHSFDTVLAEFAPKVGIASRLHSLKWFRISEAKESGRSAAW